MAHNIKAKHRAVTTFSIKEPSLLWIDVIA
jgi:hypothetical protein